MSNVEYPFPFIILLEFHLKIAVKIRYFDCSSKNLLTVEDGLWNYVTRIIKYANKNIIRCVIQKSSYFLRKIKLLIDKCCIKNAASTVKIQICHGFSK